MQKVFIILTSLFAVFLFWIIYLANTGQHSVFFDFVRRIPYGDKIGHLILFGFLTLGAVIASGFRTIGNSRLYWGAVCVFMFVLVEEVTQQFFPSRTMDINDVVADVMGIAVFSGVAYLLNRWQLSLSGKSSES